ncbi:MAG: hypothetical protein A2Y03_00685 [Omnitrophica WOR_2 bacterium GWF2_38_59]|nr:MAG: hypothetical protein A2Y03_00685 [Omnitrophica WOR_2 bacterium GWF2_38_59]OGX49507.1 MAG: hypothetical protein A2243_10520 [Omnitrophica WOR_2 bacterium RIFOXYA2_FULL_38_17]OGX58703.1 MAG: hypothetical protein A2306_12145 [Omnitrophica WOR_2 bacterium RIFOXYB2_FULL_38_16]HBG62189.1 methionyl-tRNA formyltransferase-like protein [Candidatus Omnitrophota bacterium]
MNIDQILLNATKRIKQNYFQLPIDGQEDPIYRERVYCYELYHQLRISWPDETKYELSGEVDKSGHPLIRGNNLDNVKPDLLVHIPGDMRGNYLVIEVKPLIANKEGIKKDLKTLTAFRRYAGYRKAIYLFYGQGDIQYKINQIMGLAKDEAEIDLSQIELWWHSEVGSSAEKI